MINYKDITNEFYSSSKNLRLGQLVQSPNFTLIEAMTAVKLGDHSLDSFLSSTFDRTINFNFNSRLSIDDIIYVIDRTTKLELLFHSGHHLLQSLFTSLYIHKLNSISLHNLKLLNLSISDDEHGHYDFELLGLILRSSLLTILFNSNTVHSDLIKGTLYDIEDFHSDRSGLSLGDNLSHNYVSQLLIDSINWLKYRLSSDNNNQSLLQLLFRVEFRLKTLYLFDSKYSINLLLNQNNTNLPSPNSALNVLSNISPTPEPSLEATLKFDPNISKFLPNNAPIPPIDEKLLNVQGALPYKQFEPILKALQNLHDSTNIQDPLEWLNFVSFRSILTNNDIQTPAYVRNLTLILFISDNNLIFHKYPIDWIPDGIFESMIGLPSGLINLIYELKSFGSPLSTTSIDAFEIWIQRFSGFYVNLFSTYCHNRSRQKRNLPKCIKQFEDLYYEINTFVEDVTTTVSVISTTFASLISLIPLVTRIIILNLHIESLLSTTELDLLDNEFDWKIIYWQLNKVTKLLQAELNTNKLKLERLPLDHKINFTSDIKTKAIYYMIEKIKFSNILESLSSATLRSLYVIPIPTTEISINESRARFERRLKWAFRGNIESNDLTETDPKFDQFQTTLQSIHDSKKNLEASQLYYESSIDRINELLSVQDLSDIKLKLSKNMRNNLLNNLKIVCKHNLKLLSDVEGKSMKWTNDFHPWFPNLINY